jgi:hypothetical protein
LDQIPLSKPLSTAALIAGFQISQFQHDTAREFKGEREGGNLTRGTR